MTKIKVGSRVSIPNYDYLSDGKVKKIVVSPEKNPFGFIIKLDRKAPIEYAFDTDEVFMFPKDIELLDDENTE